MPDEIGPEQQRLTDRLFNDPNRRTLNFNIFPGERRVTAEELCREVNSAMDQIERGEAEEVSYGPPITGLPSMPVDEWLATVLNKSKSE
jgi:hypothetical protein